jgi:hypothetical protein
MGAAPPPARPAPGAAVAAVAQVDQRARALVAGLPTNRAYLDALARDHASLEATA